jgi:hypothetical protein
VWGSLGSGLLSPIAVSPTNGNKLLDSPESGTILVGVTGWLLLAACLLIAGLVYVKSAKVGFFYPNFLSRHIHADSECSGGSAFEPSDYLIYKSSLMMNHGRKGKLIVNTSYDHRGDNATGVDRSIRQREFDGHRIVVFNFSIKPDLHSFPPFIFGRFVGEKRQRKRGSRVLIGANRFLLIQRISEGISRAEYETMAGFDAHSHGSPYVFNDDDNTQPYKIAAENNILVGDHFRNLYPWSICCFKLLLHDANLLLGGLRLKPHLIQSAESENSGPDSSPEGNGFQAKPYPIPPRIFWAVALLGSVIFCYGWWKLNLGPYIYWRWWLLLVALGVCLIVYGLNAALDCAEAINNPLQESQLALIHARASRVASVEAL